MENNISCYVYTKKILASFGNNTLKKNRKCKGLQFNHDLVTSKFKSRREKKRKNREVKKELREYTN